MLNQVTLGSQRLDDCALGVALLSADSATGLRAGQRIVVIPAHGCTTVNLHSAVLMVTRESSRRDLVSARGWNCCVPVPGPVVDKPLQATFDLGLGITVCEVARDRSLKLACEDAGRFGVG